MGGQCLADSSGTHRLVYVVLECIRRGHWGVGYVGLLAALFLSRDMVSVTRPTTWKALKAHYNERESYVMF